MNLNILFLLICIYFKTVIGIRIQIIKPPLKPGKPGLFGVSSFGGIPFGAAPFGVTPFSWQSIGNFASNLGTVANNFAALQNHTQDILADPQHFTPIQNISHFQNYNSNQNNNQNQNYQRPVAHPFPINNVNPNLQVSTYSAQVPPYHYDEVEYEEYDESGNDDSDDDDDSYSADYEIAPTSYATFENDGTPTCPQCICGTPNHKRIVGGVPVHYNKYPWLAQLNYNGRFYCGGTLINDRYVITAAHCVRGFRPSYMTVRLMQFNRSISGGVMRRVSKTIIHGGYSTRNLENDVALVKLDHPVPVKGIIKPICLPNPTNSFISAVGVVSGWGTTSVQSGRPAQVLQEVKVPIISNDSCRRTVYGPVISQKMICAGYVRDGGRDACQGDSGGPLTVQTGPVYQIAGVVSFGNGCALRNSPGVYTRVTSYMSWILNNARDACYCNPPPLIP